MSRAAVRAFLALLVAGGAAFVGCAAPEPRHVPPLYQTHGPDLCTVAVYRFRVAPPVSATGETAKPGAGLRRVDQLAGAGAAAQESVVDLLNGDERTQGLSGWEERAATDVPPPFRFSKRPSDVDVSLRARAVEEEAPIDLTPEQVRQMALWGQATQVVVGEVRGVTIDSGGSEGTTLAKQTLMAPPGEGVVACEARFVLYDGATGERILDRVVPASATFRHKDLANGYDKLAYGETCARRCLFNAAWRFVAEILPHYRVDVVDMKAERTRYVQEGPGYDDRGHPYSYLNGR